MLVSRWLLQLYTHSSINNRSMTVYLINSRIQWVHCLKLSMMYCKYIASAEFPWFISILAKCPPASNLASPIGHTVYALLSVIIFAKKPPQVVAEKIHLVLHQ